MLSFFGEQCLKDAVVERVKKHQRLDQIVQGTYWDGTRGCAIGCVLHSGEHMAYERQLGLPVFLAYMDEHVFECLPIDVAKLWPLRFIEAVPVGVDLSLVFPRYMYWLLSDPGGMRQNADARALPIIDVLVAMYARRIEGIPFDRNAAWSAASSAESAAWSAASSAESAAWSARSAARSAESAAGSAESAAWSAAWSARSAARSAESAAGSAAICRQADYLIALLESYESKPLRSAIPCEERYAWLTAKV